MLGSLWGHPIDYWDKIGYWAMLLGGVFGGLGFLSSLGASIVLYRVADAQGEVIKANAAATEGRLLHERRLTANERWRLARVEKIVLPRTLTQQQHDQLVAALKGSLRSITIYSLQDWESMSYAMTLRQTLMDAAITVKFAQIPPDQTLMGVHVFPQENEQAQKLSEKLWRNGNIGGGQIGIKIQEFATSVTKNGEITLFVGVNDAVMRAPDGQDGEGLDANGIPVPEPSR